MKMFRRIEPGLNPDIEIGEFLADARLRPRAAAAGIAVIRSRRPTSRPRSPCCRDTSSTRATAWQVTIEELGRYFERTLALASPTVSHADARAWAFDHGAPPPPEVAEAIGVVPDDGGGARPAHRRAASPSRRGGPGRRRRLGWKPMTAEDLRSLTTRDAGAMRPSSCDQLESALDRDWTIAGARSRAACWRGATISCASSMT